MALRIPAMVLTRKCRLCVVINMDAVSYTHLKASGKEYLFNGGKWASTPLKYNILKGVDGVREINLTQPISAINIYLFIECYQKEILDFLENNNCFSLRYHRKNNDLFYKRKSNRLTEYFAKTSKKINKSVLQQTGAYFKIHKFNSCLLYTSRCV